MLMKKLLFIFGLLAILTTACGQQPVPIQSIYDIQPYLEEKLGTPSSFEIAYKGERRAKFYTTLYFRYKNRPDLSFAKVAKILSQGFGEPVNAKGKSIPPIQGGLIPLYKTRGENIYKVNFSISQTIGEGTICIFDDQSEIPIPTK